MRVKQTKQLLNQFENLLKLTKKKFVIMHKENPTIFSNANQNPVWLCQSCITAMVIINHKLL